MILGHCFDIEKHRHMRTKCDPNQENKHSLLCKYSSYEDGIHTIGKLKLRRL